MLVFITGGAGFIGSHVADALLARGDSVVILDDFSTGKQSNIEQALAAGAGLIEGDVLAEEPLARAVADARPDALVHLAAQSQVRRSMSEPSLDASVNVVGTVNALEAARAAGVARFIFASTGGAIYGEGSRIDLPAGEAAPLEPLCPYGQSKLAAEQYLDLYRRIHGLSTLAMRFANVYGPRQDPRGEAGAVATFGELLLEGRRPVIFGDGTQTRDFVYIDDVVGAVLAALDSEVHGPLNVGTGIETNLLALLDSLAAAGVETGRVDGAAADAFRPVFEESRAGEVSRIAVDPARVREQLGWEPTTGLDQGLARTLASLG